MLLPGIDMALSYLHTVRQFAAPLYHHDTVKESTAVVCHLGLDSLSCSTCSISSNLVGFMHSTYDRVLPR